MKKYMKFLPVFVFMSFLLTTSCNNDDDVPPPVNDTDAQDPDDTVDEVPADYPALKALYEANSNNTLGWDIDDTSMKSWAGVTLNNARVTELRVSLKNISQLVPEIGQLTELTKLFIEDNSIEEIPNVVGDLTKLLELEMYNNALGELPREIGKLQQLEELSLTNNPLVEIPQEICELDANIQKDATMYCEGTIKDHNALKTLYYANTNNTLNWGNNIDDISMTGWDGITVSTINERVTEVQLFQSGISVLVSDIGDLVALQSLTLTWNGLLSGVPSSIGKLSDLTELYLTKTGIEELPSEIGDLVNLEILSLDDNLLMEIPDSMAELAKIETIYLQGNKLSTVSKDLVNLIKLVKLDLEDNPLTELPPEICNMYAAGVVKLDQTQIDNGICQ